MNKNIIIKLVFMLLLSINAGAQSINYQKDFNLYYEKSSPMSMMPLLTQKSISTCYAHTTSQFLEYMAYAEPEKYSDLKSINPIDLAIQNKKARFGKLINTDKNSYEHSRVNWVFKNFEKLNLCSREKIEESFDQVFHAERKHLSQEEITNFLTIGFKYKSSTLNYDLWLDSMAKNYDVLSEVFNNPSLNAIFEEAKKNNPNITKQESDTLAYAKSREYLVENGIFFEKIFRLVAGSKQNNIFDFFNIDIFTQCNIQGIRKKHTQLPKMKLDAFVYVSENRMEKVIEKRLVESKAPVILGHCVSWLEDENHSNKFIQKLIPQVLYKTLSSSCGAHYVNVVGKRTVDNKKQFLLMNTHGPDMTMDNHKGCHCRNAQSEKSYNCDSPGESDNEDEQVLACWYPMATIFKATFEIYSVDRQN